MADINDVRATKYARSVLGKKGVDLVQADVRCQHGVVFIRGLLKRAPKTEIKSVEEVVLLAAKMIKSQPAVKEVVLECTYKEDYFK